jgi:GntR family transcriptional regulator
MFAIEPNSGVPIYRQVVDQVVQQIDRGQIEHGELLPSVRQLALEVGVNPMTVSKAYSILESDHVVERKRGVGMVVIKKAARPNALLKPTIAQLVADAKQTGVTEAELTRLIRAQWKRKVTT